MTTTEERTLAAPDRATSTSARNGRPPAGPRRYLVINGHMMDVTGTKTDHADETFSVHPAVEQTYEYFTTHHSVINAATIMQMLRDLADAIQRDTTVAVKTALKGELSEQELRVFGNPPDPRPKHIKER